MVDKIELGFFRIRMILKLTITTHPFIISEYPDAISEVVNMKQTGTVDDYYEELKGFCNMLQLFEEDALHIFINNLKPEISKAVSLFYPQTLTHALELAKQVELKLAVEFNDPEIEETEAEIEDAEFEEAQVEAEIEVGAQAVIMRDQVQLTKLEDDEKSMVQLGKGNSDLAEQLTVDQVSCHEVPNKTSNIIDVCEKFDAINSMRFVEEIFVVNNPYGFRLLVMSNDNFFISGFSHFFKCNMHINPEKYKSFSSGFGVWLKEQGAKGIFMGEVPIVLVYNAHGACKMDFYEVFKGLLHYMLAKKRVGVKTISLEDQRVVELWNLSNNFVFPETDVGKNKALTFVQKLQELNNAVIISTLTTKLSKEQLSDFQVVVFTDISFEKDTEFNDYCHNYQAPISFIMVEVRGLFGSIFCDFGPQFTVVDVDREDPHTGITASISNDNPAFVSCVDDERLEFQDGNLVVFSEVHGMTELNDGKTRKIKSAMPYPFNLEEDTTNFDMYIKGGIVTLVKQPKVLNFKPLREALKDPGDFLLSNFSKFDRPHLLHLAFQALDKFVFDLGCFPAGSEEDVQKLVFIAANNNECLGEGKVGDINLKLLRQFVFGVKAVLNSMAAMFRGIVRQKVVKACSGKFQPLFQFFYFDSVQSLPAEPLDPSDFKPLNSYYDVQISVFGSKLQKKLEDAEVFLVGFEALGCEFQKNVAFMGVSCGSQGKLTIIDDVIEKSNLSKQFLFHYWNIGQAKSTVDAFVTISITLQLKIEALQNRVGPETESVFNDPFWSAPKRFPHPLQFSTAGPNHLYFIMAASILKADHALVDDVIITNELLFKLYLMLKGMDNTKGDPGVLMVLSCKEAPPNIDIKHIDKVVVLATKNLALVSEVGLGADVVRMTGNAVSSLGFSYDSSLQVTYTVKTQMSWFSSLRTRMF